MIHTETCRYERQSRPDTAADVVVFDNQALINEYLEWKRSYAPKAAAIYEIWVRRFQDLTNKAPEAMTMADWSTFATSLSGRFAPKSVQLALSIVHNYLRFWHEQGRLRRLPLYLARVPKTRGNPHNTIKEEEYRRMLEVLRREGDFSLRDQAILMLLRDTGVRVGELVSLEIEAIEEDRSAVIRTEKSVRNRRIFWNADTDQIVHRLVVERVNSGSRSDCLFVAKKGSGDRPLRTRSVEYMIRATARKAGIERKLSPHSFRHAYVHRLAALGIPDAIIAQLVGHGTPHTISQYTKLSRVEFEEAARKQFHREIRIAA